LEHLFEIAIAERIAQIPGNRLPDQPCLELPSFEWCFGFSAMALRTINTAHQQIGAPSHRPILKTGSTKKLCDTSFASASAAGTILAAVLFSAFSTLVIHLQGAPGFSTTSVFNRCPLY